MFAELRLRLRLSLSLMLSPSLSLRLGQSGVRVGDLDESADVLVPGGADRPEALLHPQVVHPHHRPVAADDRA